MSRPHQVIPLPRTLALVAGDAAVLLLSYLAAFLLSVDASELLTTIVSEPSLQTALAISIGQFFLVGYFLGIYDSSQLQLRFLLLQRLALIVGSQFLLQALLGFFGTGGQLPYTVMFYGSMLVLVLLPIWRIPFFSRVQHLFPKRRLLFLEPLGPLVEDLIQDLAVNPSTAQIVGYLNAEDRKLAIPHLGAMEDLEEVVRIHQPTIIVVGQGGNPSMHLMRQLLDLQWTGITCDDISVVYENLLHRTATADITPSRLLLSSGFDPHPSSVLLHDVYSWLLALGAALLTLPVLLPIVIALRLAAPLTPALRKEPYWGYRDKVFMRLSLRVGKMENGRRTPWGDWLHRTRLESLPQLWNVLRGDMALFGPAPVHAAFAPVLQQHIPFFSFRHAIRPGLLGWSQIHGHPVDLLTGLEYDFFYIKMLAPNLDAHVLLHSLRAAEPASPGPSS